MEAKSKLKVAFEKVDPGDIMYREWIQDFQNDGEKTKVGDK